MIEKMHRCPVFALACLIGVGFLAGFATADEPWSADPDLVEKKMRDRGGFNYRESDVPTDPLPEILTFASGAPVDAAKWPQRRNELLELFREHVYGRRPEVDYELAFDIEAEQPGVFDGAADGRQVRVRVLCGDRTYAFTILMFVPVNASDKPQRFPAVVFLNNREMPSFESVVKEPGDFWPADVICQAGFVAVAISTHQIDPDRKDGYADGIRSFLANRQEETNNPAAWRALSAWGWGISRAIDYLEQVPQVDSKRIAVAGHSRGGKAALWAAAEDPRIAIAYSNNSGCGGAALSRRRYGETVQRITSVFPYWFCRRFAEYGDDENRLPVDQHQLIALLAPRGVYVTSATEDLWADPRGEYLSLTQAAPAYALLGHSTIVDPTMPPVDHSQVVGCSGYHIRTGGHGLETSDWKFFLAFAKQFYSGDR